MNIRHPEKLLPYRLVLFEEDHPTLQSIKPKRRRLPARPRVKSGSNAEVEWAKKCIEIILEYENALKLYDKEARLPLPDLEKLVGYYELCGRIRKYQKGIVN